jgi:hypothetical protein
VTNANDFVVGNAPDLLAEIAGIAKPVINPIVIPAAPAYLAPQFLGVSPNQPPAPPTGLDATMRDNYASISLTMRQAIEGELDSFIDRTFPGFRTGLAAIESRLAVYLAGGTALTGTVQDQIFARAVAKTDTEYRRGRANVYDEAARAGHTMPSPIIAAKVQQFEQDRRNANASVGRDLMVKIAEMEQQNLQFAVTQSVSLRGIMLNAGIGFYTGLVQINGQALEYARSIVDAIVKVYDVAMRFSEIQARIYEAEGNIYQAKVRGALGVLEAYTAQVRGLEAQANVDTAIVNAYTARIGAVKAEAEVYTAQVNAVAVRASIEKLKAEIYQTRVQAYAAQVNAYVARWQGYEAAVRGEAAVIQAAAESVRAYSAQAEAYRTIIQARTAQIEGIIKSNEGQIRVLDAAVNVYKTKVSALAEVNTAKIASFELTLKSYNSLVAAQTEHTRAELARFQAALQAVISDTEVIIRVMEDAHKLDVSRVEAVGRLAAAAANNYSSVAQAALSGMNTLIAQTAQT